MLDRPKPPRRTPFEKAFNDWWVAQVPGVRQAMDAGLARLAFRAGYTSGHRKDLKRYIFRARRFRITVWANSPMQARQKAIEEANFRAAAKGWSTPKGGWILEELK